MCELFPSCDHGPYQSCLSFCRPGGIPARNAAGERLLLFIGIIDILQSYRLKKKLEHTFKSIVTDGVSKLMCILFEQ